MKPPINWHEALKLYLIGGTQDVAGGDLVGLLAEAIKGGITCFQLREKGPGSLKKGEAIEGLAKECQALCRRGNIPFIVNDDVALAIKIKADGVHVGQSDKGIRETLKAVKPYGIDVGLSINTLKQFEEALELPLLDYVGIGPVFNTQSKVDAQPVVGLSLLNEAVRRSPELPKVAIGGITVANVGAVRATGVDGVAVISAITKSEAIRRRIQELGGGSSS
ncbi:thiamine phosphate synthase [uncultured Vagococcus sp.]|uniref:thiamine phosphate synthase n=1 Tax=uncultured Vagococcus sp. TaxID=189676 RepID=UPI0028D8D88F|nr:thiamine phosphate synthase [uncultured Vagococcus sp.]